MCKHSQQLILLTFIVLSLFYSTTFMSVCIDICKLTYKLTTILPKPNSMASKWIMVWVRQVLIGWELDQKIKEPYHKYICEKSKKQEKGRRWLWKWTLWFLIHFHFNSLYVTTALLCGLLPSQQWHKRVAHRPIGCDTAPRWQKTATTQQSAKLSIGSAQSQQESANVPKKNK